MRIPLNAGDGGLDYDYWAKWDQVATLEKNLLKYPAIGFLPRGKIELIEEQVRLCLGLF